MAPSFLVVGATGNTGRGVVETLSNLLQASQTFSSYRILAQTRSANSSTAKELAKYPRVEIIEYNWTEITAQWLRDHEVARAFIASHNQPNQFAEESTFHIAALRAGVKYVVRISTTAANVRPDCDAYYPRTHWAIETMLESPPFVNLHWTSLQPNVFSTFWLGNAAEMIKKVQSGGKQDTLRLLASRYAPIGIIDPQDVSVVAAKLLLQQDTTVHNKAKYVLNGPEDITGDQIVAMVEERIGAKVEDVKFKDSTFLDDMVAASSESKNVIESIRHAAEVAWAGLCKAETTSKEILELTAPKKTPAEVLEMLLR
ncbi:NAD(P)-binding protein [Macroventuria anomochaeta]|uniref:NAD(P)-binding protein n=1 Tax=Macroventuria anomochaeta TaxID=301207 RepID=A0ACB6RXU2_9PLEO|nr:NAD(P)-binding protein [Macroventuria anomochaeta]KAF2626082.1 NAD(P)-binding protein [Macroventuria anomochaeta]